VLKSLLGRDSYVCGAGRRGNGRSKPVIDLHRAHPHKVHACGVGTSKRPRSHVFSARIPSHACLHFARSISLTAPQLYAAVLKHMRRGPWYVDVLMTTAVPTWPLLYSLQAFWPGLQARGRCRQCHGLSSILPRCPPCVTRCALVRLALGEVGEGDRRATEWGPLRHWRIKERLPRRAGTARCLSSSFHEGCK